MEPPVKHFMGYQIGDKPVPPAEMIPDHQHRQVMIIEFSVNSKLAEVPPDHLLRIDPEKPGKKRPVARLDHGLQDLSW
jgi:hypothetical protein